MREGRMKVVCLLLVLSVIAFADNTQENVRDCLSDINGGGAGGIGDWDYPTDLLYDNGPFVTGVGAGSGGADISEMQDGDGTYGYGFQVSSGNMVADYFEVPTGETWEINKVTIFGYQTGSGTTPTINDIRFCVYDDVPTTATIIYGDMTTNVLTSNAWTNCYRVNTGTYTNTDRPIMANECEVSGLTLTEGDYWLCFQAGGTGSSGPWANPVTQDGIPSSGIAMQYTSSGWASMTQGSYGVTMPFLFDGPTALSRSTWGEIKSLF